MKGPGHDDDSKAEDRTATRYIDRVVLRAIDRRVVSRATDSLSDRPVLYKVAPREETLREARALLEAPPDLAPRLLDFGELDGTAAFLVTEWLDGPSLLRAPPAAERTVEVAASLASLVTRLHRANWVHSDLKPGNVVWADAACTSLRLIDFGFAFRADQGPEDEEGRGGSPGYAAPELTRGWRIDARVDQFALGVILSELFPALAADAECAAIFARMTALLPSARFADMVGATTALLQALERHEKVEADLKPRLGGGPLREREQLLASIGQALRAERSEEGALVLLHGAPGAGLSRLLLEIACVSQGVQVLEVETAWKNDTLEGRVLAQVKAALTKREPLVVGIADPSPELRTLGAAPTLRALLLERSSARVTIPRLSVEGFASVVAHALRDEPDDGRSAALHQSSDGDLHLAATLFADGAESMSKVAGAPRAPRWEAVPSDERVTLAIVDRCGAAPDFSIARRAVELLQGASAIDATIAAGWIHRDDRDRVAFTAESLRRAARELTLTDAARLDAWLLDNLIPDPDRPTELRESIDRASRLGRNEDEARILRCALDRAVTQGTHSRYLQLFEATGHH
ncbi:MAG: protein kinase, partial [Candidatus Eisenbacteria bacterium]